MFVSIFILQPMSVHMCFDKVNIYILIGNWLYSQYSIYLIHEIYSFLDQIRYLLKQYFVFLLGSCMRSSGLLFNLCILSQGMLSIFYVCLLY